MFLLLLFLVEIYLCLALFKVRLTENVFCQEKEKTAGAIGLFCEIKMHYLLAHGVISFRLSIYFFSYIEIIKSRSVSRGLPLSSFSASSLEVLAVVAYNQPVTRSFIDQVRGVDSSYAVSSLIDKGLIESCGRLDAPGRPMLYATSDKFLRVFGFNSLDDLPKTEPLVNPEEAGQQLMIEDPDKAEAPAEEQTAE